MSTLLLVLTLFALQCPYIDNNCAGEVTLVRPERNIGQHTAVLEPQDDVAACWPQQRLLAVLTHRPGHWISYRKVVLCYVHSICYWTRDYKVKNWFINDTDYYLTLETSIFRLSVH